MQLNMILHYCAQSQIWKSRELTGMTDHLNQILMQDFAAAQCHYNAVQRIIAVRGGFENLDRFGHTKKRFNGQVQT
jgi:hypothetical protein